MKAHGLLIILCDGLVFPGGYSISGLFLPGENELSPRGIQVVYGSKDGKDEKVFDALEWLAAIDIHSCTR